MAFFRWTYFIVIGILIIPTLSQAQPTHRGAGVLPYTLSAQGEPMILLGFQQKRGWTCFGGGPKEVHSLNSPSPRWETPRETALRECLEETRFLIPRQELIEKLKTAAQFPEQPGPRSFLTYVIPVAPIDTSPFYTTMVPLNADYTEHQDIAWIPLAELKHKAQTPGYRIKTPNGQGLWDVFWKGIAPVIQDSHRYHRLFNLSPITGE
ncbi:MAG: NUDIX hydrolase [Desulfobacterales bacterium]|nr:NUDIX hydrolase [Desulfobacterales bacterium]